MIKHPFNFGVGLWCGFCLVVSIALGRDISTIALIAVFTALNLLMGFVE